MIRLCSAILAIAIAVPVLADTPQPPPRRALLCCQKPDGHPKTTHEYVAGLKILKQLLEQQEGLEVRVVQADSPWTDGPQLLESADVAVLFLAEGARWVSDDPDRLRAFQSLARRGGGLVCLHWAMGSRTAEPVPEFVALFGGCHGGPDRKYKFLETELRPTSESHPITRGVAPIRVDDEFYYRLKFPTERNGWASVLEAEIDATWETVGWAWQRPDGGRSVGFSGLHRHANWGELAYRRSIVQGVLWTLKREIPPEGVAVPLDPADLKLPETP
jgi:type 1 glutamine amidotransferase